MENRLGKNAVLAARIFFLPAAAGFAGLFVLNFLLVLFALLFLSFGILCAPAGGLYCAGILQIVSDLSPAALTAAGLFCLFFGCFLSFLIVRFAPFCYRLLQKYSAAVKGYKWRRLYLPLKHNIKKFLFLSFALSLFMLAAAAEIQYLSVQSGFKSTVVRERLVFDNAKYLKISTSSLDFELKYHDGDGILVEYVNDTPMLIEQADVNYLKLVQDDSFTLSLFARDQFSYKMVISLPANDYREFYLDSGSGSVRLTETLSEYTELHTRSGDIVISEATGRISAYSIAGDISCGYSAFIAPGSFETGSGDILVELPDYSGVRLEFRTESGYLKSELMGFEEKFYGSVDKEKIAPLWSYLYVTTGSGNAVVEKNT